METVLTKRVTEIAETNSLLPNCQMGNRKGRSTDTALELLLEQIHTVWGLKKVASVLSLDIAGAFDTVNHIRLLENLRAKGLPRQLIQTIRSFLDQRKTTLMVDGIEIGPRALHAGVPQGSPLSPILFLFYNGTLLDRLENTALPISPLGFADDTNLWASSSELQLLDVVSPKASRLVSSAKPRGEIGSVVFSRRSSSVPL